VVGETGTVSLAETSLTAMRSTRAHSGAIAGDWRERFVRAYDTELAEWVASIVAGRIAGPTAWDG
jgi:myo-inositol 2-dehydrogenase/D-chiro-inositol 1-dehydrogenase